MRWLLGALLLLIVIGLFWDVFARRRRGRALAWGLVAGFAAVVAAVIQGASVEGPWTLLAWLAFAVLLVAALRAERQPRTEQNR
jgi:hypothetical protein